MKNRKIKVAVIIAAVMFFAIAGAQGTFSLIEINPLHGNSAITATSDSSKTYYGAGELKGFTAMGGKLYFVAQGSPGDDELWVTNGTQGGTNLVKAINPGHGAGIGNLVLLGSHIIFMATENGTSWDLWSSDGTDTGTKIIDTLNQTSNVALGYTSFSQLGNRIIFCSTEKILITDGSAHGTDSLSSIAAYSQGFGYCDMAGQSYFILPELTGTSEIWRSDGTPLGTRSVLSLDTSAFNINLVNSMQAFNGKLYFAGAQTGHTADLFTFDGNPGGQINRIAITPGVSSNPHGFNVYNGSLYFIAGNGTSANLYRISATDSVPQPLIPNASFSSLSNLTIANNTAYCIGPDNKHIYGIELTGFSNNALELAGYTLPTFAAMDYSFLIGLNQQIYFEAYDSITGKQLLLHSDFTSGGTGVTMPADANTVHPFNSHLNNGIHDVFDLKTWGGKIVVPANFDSAGRELWIFDPNGVNAIAAINSGQPFIIYPNPANNELTIKANFTPDVVPFLKIFNITGQLVLQETLRNELTLMNVSKLDAGAYFVTLTQNGGSTNVQKLLVVK